MKVRKWLCILLALMLTLSLVGCGAESLTDSIQSNAMGALDAEYSYNGESYKEMDMLYGESTSSPSKGEPADGSSQLPANRKWVITVELDAETEDLDALLEQVYDKINQLGGYVEDQNIYNGSSYYSGTRYRNADLTVRIPASKVDSFTEHMAGMSNIVSNNKNLKDVTLDYVDIESRLNALRAEEERLLELMDMAETMYDLLEIEERLTDVRYQLESAESQLRTYDNLVDYATIYLDIEEVKEYTPVEDKNFFQRVGEGFMDSLKGLWNFFVNLVEWILVKLPYLVFLGAIGVLVVWLYRKNKKKKAAKRKNAPVPPMPNPNMRPPYPPVQNPNMRPPYPPVQNPGAQQPFPVPEKKDNQE